MDIAEAIRIRKSVRAYLDRPVPADDLEKILAAGRWAPNAGPFHLSVIRNAALRQKINDMTHKAMLDSGIEFLQQRASLQGYQPLYGAPVLILVSAPLDSPYGTVNAALAAENMILQATGLSLGSCFLVSPSLALKGEPNRDLAKQAGIPEGYELKCAVIAGYPAAEDRFSAAERARKGSVSYID